MKKQVAQRKKESGGTQKAGTIRKRQHEDKFDKRAKLNNDKRQGLRRGRFRDAETVQAVELEKPVHETNKLRIKQFTRVAQIEWIINEIAHIQMIDTNLRHDESGIVDELKRRCKKVKDAKRELKNVLHASDDDAWFIPITFRAADFLQRK